MRSLSVTTISRTSSYGLWVSTSLMWPLCSGVIHSPRARRKMRLYCWQASPTVGV